jgi:3-methyladenine DNA glycosylase AlkD
MIEQELKKIGNKEKAKHLSYFFKTGKGEYGEGDKFIGATVPEQRKIAKKYADINFNDLQKILNSEFHECRLTALLILVERYKEDKEKVFNFYIKNFRNINNWDLVDLSCPKIVGDYLFDKDRELLFGLVKSENMWERRVAIVSTYYFIKQNDLDDTFKIAKLLLNDKQDLMHKATGWMLREAGKKDKERLVVFIENNYYNIPRTALRYAIERFEENKRKYFLNKKYEIR